jgi:hypothetical protein
MASSPELVLGKEGLKKVENARVFMVGCGGIGCELLKDLVGAGFINLDIVNKYLLWNAFLFFFFFFFFLLLFFVFPSLFIFVQRLTWTPSM